MAVKDVFGPKPVNPIDPKNTEEDKGGEWQKKAKEAKAQREYMEEQRNIDRIAQPEQPPESKFEFKGGVHLDIDPQRDAKEAREVAEKVREKAEQEKKERDKKIDELTAERDEKARELQDTKLTAAMKEMTGQFGAALKEMNQKIEDVKAGADPSIMVSQFKALAKLSEEMGSLGGRQVGDPSIQLEITKLNMENARAQREFEARLEQDKRAWDLQLQRFEDEREARKQAQIQEQHKYDQLGNVFETGARLVGKGITESSISKSGDEVASASKGRKSHHIEIGLGESGEIECPGCNQPVGIGPTAKAAVCANCGAKYSIKRVERQPETEEE